MGARDENHLPEGENVLPVGEIVLIAGERGRAIDRIICLAVAIIPSAGAA
jgi:hypothetical protein